MRGSQYSLSSGIRWLVKVGLVGGLISLLLLGWGLPYGRMDWVASAQPYVQQFEATLSGDQEVPPVATSASGTAQFFVGSVVYQIVVRDIQNVSQAHIHMAPRGQNGPIVAVLFNGAPLQCTTTPFSFTGTAPLASGALTDADLQGPLAGQTIDDLIAAMAAGNTYVNVHTCQNPAGEIRGQIELVPAGAPPPPAVPMLSTRGLISLLLLLGTVVIVFAHRRQALQRR